jgi:hypothetical protein
MIIDELKKYCNKNNEIRNYLGISQIGHSCDRYLWYKHKGIEETKPTDRTLMIFRLGNLIESDLVDILKKTDLPITKQQHQCVIPLDNINLIGHIDGICTIDGEDLLWECKTMNQKSFNTLLKVGYDDYSVIYKAQLHAYMLCMELKKAIVTVYNKNDSSLYEEIVNLNKEYIMDIIYRLNIILNSSQNQRRECPLSNFWKAKMCGFKNICWEDY